MSLQNKYNKLSAFSYTNLEGHYFQRIYLDWRRFSLGIEVFAADHNMSPKQALQHIEVGRRIHHDRMKRLK